MREVKCQICGHVLFKIDTNTWESVVSGNKAHFKWYGFAKPLLKHVDVFTTCEKCGDIDLHTF